MTGYLHPGYANSLSEFGFPLHLKKSDGWLLKRSIANSNSVDAMGPYPIFCCADWNALRGDFEQLGKTLVSVVLVTDPFGEYEESTLREAFPDQVIPFKHHLVADLSLPLDSVIAKHHARNARIGLGQLSVELCSDPRAHSEEWISLYSVLTARHGINGIRAFSRICFENQLALPGMVCFRALRARQTVGMILWYVQGRIAYYHLGAYTNVGYELRASFALFDTALRHFAAAGMSHASLGAGVGLGESADDGLSRFKRGWANSSRRTYLCGRVFDRDAYDALAQIRGVRDSNYFPVYRKGEFA